MSKKVDTSAWSVAQTVLGEDRTNISEISPDTWMVVIEDMYRHRLVSEIPGVFKRIGDLMGDEKHSFIPCKVPRQVTRFDQGLGVNTIVRQIGFKEPGMREKDLPVMHMSYSILLLLKPEEGREFGWAQWDIKYRLLTQKGYRRDSFESSIFYLSREKVLDIFLLQPGIPLLLSDIGLEMKSHAENLFKKAIEMAVLAGKLSEVPRRIYVPSE